jgi:hypothetical protein
MQGFRQRVRNALDHIKPGPLEYIDFSQDSIYKKPDLYSQLEHIRNTLENKLGYHILKIKRGEETVLTKDLELWNLLTRNVCVSVKDGYTYSGFPALSSPVSALVVGLITGLETVGGSCPLPKDDDTGYYWNLIKIEDNEGHMHQVDLSLTLDEFSGYDNKVSIIKQHNGILNPRKSETRLINEVIDGNSEEGHMGVKQMIEIRGETGEFPSKRDIGNCLELKIAAVELTEEILGTLI